MIPRWNCASHLDGERQGLGLRHMMMVAIGVMSVTPVAAHEFEDVSVSSVRDNGVGFYEVQLEDTVNWQMVVCALYDGGGKLLASHQAFTTNLATKFLIRYAGDDVATARCVRN